MTIDEVHEILDELSGDIPQAFFKELNGGINLLPNVVYSPHARANDLYIMGDYNRGSPMGRYINIYYGSLMRVYSHLSRDELRKELWDILRHEFRHHLESLGGERGLEIEDAEAIKSYLEGNR